MKKRILGLIIITGLLFVGCSSSNDVCNFKDYEISIIAEDGENVFDNYDLYETKMKKGLDGLVDHEIEENKRLTNEALMNLNKIESDNRGELSEFEQDTLNELKECYEYLNTTFEYNSDTQEKAYDVKEIIIDKIIGDRKPEGN